MPKFRTSDGLALHYEDDGEGRPVLCLAGLTRNARDFTFLAPHMRDCRLIRLDSRGRGESDYDPDYMNYNVIREGHDAIELLDHLELDRVTVIGTSRGGLIAMALAASHPERLAGVVLNDIGPVVGPAGLARIMDYVGKEPPYTDYEDAADGLLAASGDEFPGVPRERWRAQAENMWVEKPGGGLGLRYDANLHRALLEQSASGAQPDLWMFFEALAEIPVGVLRGANSDILDPGTVEGMHRRHPGLISASVPDRGHVPFLDEPVSLDLIGRLMERAA
ncbi:alpha/beta fold hydrolase [Roseovarius salinarum]|uniref:alpha/beta fold hydrolase n=1 Tax=Roseovarius salinarum TaxID=1981892 RepID=UPI000C34ED8C|nr:alpha/beta hydrolase [Roseovarius salinarum]